MFELNFELITDIRFYQKSINDEAEGFVSAEECRNLLRGVPGKKEDAKTQLEEVWGKNEMFDKPPPRAERIYYSRWFRRVASQVRLAGSLLFGSVRSSRSHNLRSFVRPSVRS